MTRFGMVSATYFWQYETTVFGNQLLDKLEGVTKSLAQGLCEEVKDFTRLKWDMIHEQWS